METVEETRKPEEIERDIEKTRSQMAGTLDDIQRSFSPGQMLDQALGYLEDKTGRFGSQVSGLVRDNPVPATLVGVGLAWLATAGWSEARERPEGSRYSRPMPPERGRRSGGVRYGTRSRQAASGEYGYGETHYGPDYRYGGEPERKEETGAAMGETLGQVRGAMDEATETVRRKAGETAEQVRETYGQVREKAGEMTEEARRRAVEMGHEVKERTRRVVRDEPLVVGALGLAVGAALGAWLPRTAPEDRWLGPARDELLHQADQTGGDMLREVREHVAAGMESAKAHAQGEMPEGGTAPAGSEGGTTARPQSEPGRTRPEGETIERKPEPTV